MREFLAIAISFLAIPLWLKLKLDFWIVLLITAGLLCIISGMEFNTALSCIQSAFLNKTNLITIFVVVLVSILSSLLKKYHIIEKGIESLQKLIRNPKIIIMIIPAVFGMLQVPGGAAMSAPFVDKVGDQLNIDQSKKAVLNLSFRHIAMFLLPFTSTMVYLEGVLDTAGSSINIYHLVLLNLGFVICMQLSAYMLFLRKEKAVLAGPAAGMSEKTEALKDILICFSPIYLVIVFNGVFGLPLWGSLICSIVLTFFLSTKEHFLKNIVQGINVKTVLIMFAVYLVGEIIKSMDYVMSVFNYMFLNSSGILVLFVVCGIALLLGLTTGLMLIPFSVLLPIIAELPMGTMERTILVSFVFTWSFVGYYYSPLHLCQILTVDYMKCGLPDVYKYNMKLCLCTAVIPFILYYLYSFILL